jgi:hypothetical protein
MHHESQQAAPDSGKQREPYLAMALVYGDSLWGNKLAPLVLKAATLLCSSRFFVNARSETNKNRSREASD